MLAAGDALLLPDPDNPESRHLFIIISDPQQDLERVLLANVTTWEEYKDDACILEPDDWPGFGFLKHKSCIDYRRAVIQTARRIERLLESGQAVSRPRVSPELLQKILKGAEESRFLSGKCALLLAEQGLIES